MLNFIQSFMNSNNEHDEHSYKDYVLSVIRAQIDVLSVMVCENSEHYFKPQDQPKEFESATLSVVVSNINNLYDKAFIYANRDQITFLKYFGNDHLCLKSLCKCFGYLDKIETICKRHNEQQLIAQSIQDDQDYIELKQEILEVSLPNLIELYHNLDKTNF